MQIIDNNQAKACCALHPSGAAGKLGNGERGRVINEKGSRRDAIAGRDQPVKLLTVQLAAANLFRINLRALTQNSCSQLFCCHFQREKGDRRCHFTGAGRGCGVKGHIGCQRRLAHRRASGKDDQIGAMQPAKQIVQIGQACAGSRQMTVTFAGDVGLID